MEAKINQNFLGNDYLIVYHVVHKMIMFTHRHFIHHLLMKNNSKFVWKLTSSFTFTLYFSFISEIFFAFVKKFVVKSFSFSKPSIFGIKGECGSYYEIECFGDDWVCSK